MTITAEQVKQLNELLDSVTRILVLGPDKPDLDSVTSNVALATTFKALGKQVKLYSYDGVSPQYEWIDGWDSYLDSDDIEQVKNFKPELVVISDAPSRVMMTDGIAGQEWLLDEVPVLVVDHHITESDLKPEVSIVDPEAAATGELLYYLYQAMGWEITPMLADLMLGGIIFDTDRFENLNTDAEVFIVVGKLLELGGNFYQTNQKIIAATAFDEARFKTLAKLQEKAVIEPPLAYCLVNYEDVGHLRPRTLLIKPLINSLRPLKGVKASFVLVAREDGKLALSMRSQPGIDVAKIAQLFGGGGHTVAAGASISGLSLETAAKQIITELHKQL